MTPFDHWKTPDVGMFMFAHSPKRLGLHLKFGFWPRAVTAIMTRAARSGPWTQSVSVTPYFFTARTDRTDARFASLGPEIEAGATAVYLINE